MANDCDIRIEIADEDTMYEPGETVTGTVHVEVNEDCQCDGLTLSLEWYTHGRGNVASQCVDQHLLFEGEWTAGEHYTYDFEIPLPPGPYRYRGRYINVDWRVRARADIPWALDPTADQELILSPSGTEEDYNPGNVDKDNLLAPVDDDRGIPWKSVLISAPFWGPGIVLAIFFDSSWLGNELLVGLMLFCLCLFPIGLYMLYLTIQDYFAEMKLGDVDLHIDPRSVCPGETVRCRTTITPLGTVHLNEISVRLHGFEQVTSGSGTKRKTYTQTIHEEETAIPESRDKPLRGGMRTFDTTLTLPDSAPYSFYAPHNKVKWVVELRIDLPWWPDWTRTRTLIVRPEYTPTS